MANYSLKEFLTKYQALQDKVAINCGEYAKEVYLNTVEDVVYKDSFQPTYHIRRYQNGGYGDRRNVRVRLIGKGVAIIDNITTGVGDTSGRIDRIIETGEGYTWNRKPSPRPVFAITKERLRHDPNLIKIARNTIEREGFKTI